MINYKKLIKSQKLRQRILNLLSFIPDKTMLGLQYYIKQGKKLNLLYPKKYTEKIQWYKLYYKNPLLVQCVDKYEVREYVISKGLKGILNECYGVYDNVDEINFSKLPNKFVLKDTIGGGSRSVIIVNDKIEMNMELVRKQMQKWLNEPHNIKNGGREWPYYTGKKHRILIEKYIDSDADKGGLIDYKFFCFNGKPQYLYVIADRCMGKNAGIGIYNSNFEKLPYKRLDERPLERTIEKPQNYEQMLEIAKKLSEDFPHVRVDLYNQDGKILFGETTFYPGSGYMQFEPEEFDLILGDTFVLPDKLDF